MYLFPYRNSAMCTVKQSIHLTLSIDLIAPSRQAIVMASDEAARGGGEDLGHKTDGGRQVNIIIPTLTKATQTTLQHARCCSPVPPPLGCRAHIKSMECPLTPPTSLPSHHRCLDNAAV